MVFKYFSISILYNTDNPTVANTGACKSHSKTNNSTRETKAEDRQTDEQTSLLVSCDTFRPVCSAAVW